MNPAAPQRNLHHTRSGWQSEQDYYEEFQRDRAEAEYFAHVEPATHNYPPTGQTAIVLVNELILEESPF